MYLQKPCRISSLAEIRFCTRKLLNFDTFAARVLPMRQVDDYTNAFLVSAGVLVFMVLFAIWAIWGLIVAGLVSWGADRLMTVDLKPRG